MVADMGLSEADRAMLLAAWFPGYLVSQIPGAALIEKIGPKLVMGGNMLGTCGLFLLLPLFVRLAPGSRQVRIMASTLTVCGFFQGPLIPGQQVMRRNWLPKPGSPARPIHMKLISLGGLASELLAKSVTPVIAGALGWRAVNTVMGGGGLLLALCWFAFAKSTPTQFRRRGDSSGAILSAAEAAKATEPPPSSPASAPEPPPPQPPPPPPPQQHQQKAASSTSSPLALFKHPCVVATLWCKMASGTDGASSPSVLLPVVCFGTSLPYDGTHSV